VANGIGGALPSPPLRPLVHSEREDIRAGVVADRVEVEARAGQGVGVEVGVDDPLATIERAGE
jgi:hypothetical protein